RNDKFDARGYFDREKLGFHQNQFGGTVLGPLNIPRIYNGHDRTFFMFSSESYRLRWGETNLGNVASELERAGYFTKTVNNAGKPIVWKDPFSAAAQAQYTPFPGNKIPSSRFSPVGVKVLSQYPLPNRAALGNNYLATATNKNDWDSFVGKVDHK